MGETTGVPPKTWCKQPPAAQWGGWSDGGAPGRRRQDGPWDSMAPGADGKRADQFGDARTRRFPEIKYHDTSHLTKWHMHADALDLHYPKQIHMNRPTVVAGASAA